MERCSRCGRNDLRRPLKLTKLRVTTQAYNGHIDDTRHTKNWSLCDHCLWIVGRAIKRSTEQVGFLGRLYERIWK